MGLKDFFSSSGRDKSRLDKLTRKVENQYAQSADRYHAMEQLLKIGTIPALVSLLRRFTMTASKSIEDEEEKGWVYRQITGLDAAVVLPAVKQFCLSHDNIAWALRIVEDMANQQQEWEILDALLAQHPPGYERDPAKKIQLLTHLQDIDDPRVPGILVRYLEDDDESVRYFVVDALIDIADPIALEPLVKRLGDPKEDSLRLRTRILNGLAQLGWDVSPYREIIAANLGNEHTFDGKRIKER